MSLNEKRIFIIEDDAANLAVISTILKRAGALVEFDRGTPDVMKHLQAVLPLDMILVDLMLPGSISGYQLYGEMRRVPELMAVPVVAVSAADAIREIPRARAAGFRGYITKPIRSQSFVNYILRVLEGETVWA